MCTELSFSQVEGETNELAADSQINQAIPWSEQIVAECKNDANTSELSTQLSFSNVYCGYIVCGLVNVIKCGEFCGTSKL